MKQQAQLNFDNQRILIYTTFMSMVGILLIFFFLSLYCIITYSIIWDNISLIHRVLKSTFISLSLLVILLWICFNIIFNFICAVLVSPGYTNQFFSQVSEQDEEANAQNGSLPFAYDPTNNNFNTSMDNIKLQQRELKFCNQCQLPKPLRSHHCQVCNKCVLKMDHHCPWINNCVGFYNHRYFLLFLFWLWAGVVLGSLTSLPIYFIEERKQSEKQMSPYHQFVQPINFILAVLIGAFAYWNWHLAIKGQTSIEFWGLKTPNSSGEKFDFSQQNMFENLKIIFGNVQHIYEIFLPSVRNLNYNGVIWENIQGEETQCLTSELGSLNMEEL